MLDRFAITSGRVERDSPVTPAKSASRLHVVDGLRGLAALAVAWFHMTRDLPSTSWLGQSGTYGWLGVEVFFVISGFIIPYSMWTSGYRLRDYGRFQAKRMLRLYPPFVAAIVLMVVLDYLGALMPGYRGKPPAHDAIELAANLTYLADIFSIPWVGVVLWSLAIEVQFYLLMGFLFVALKQSRLSTLTLLVMIGCGLMLPSTKYVFHFLPLFAAGSTVFLASTGQMSRVACALVLSLATLAVVHGFGLSAAIATLLSSLAILLIHRQPLAPLAVLGAISYSVYLIHVPIGGRIVNLGNRLAHNEGTQLVFALVGLAVSLVAGWVFYRLFERNSQRLSSRIKYKAA